MKRKNKFSILFLLIVSILLIQTIDFTTENVVCESGGYIPIVGDQTIRYDWLTITMAEDNSDYLRHNIGGFDLIEYESLGSTDTGENTFTFMSRIKFGYEINSYLSLMLRDAYPDLVTDRMSPFIEYAHITHFPLCIPLPYIDYYGKFRYSYVYYGTPDYHNDFYNIPVTIGINPTFSALDGEIINGMVIQTSEYLYEVKSMEVVLAENGLCGDNKDLYTTQGEISKGVDTTTMSDDIPTFSQQCVMDHIEELDLGWKTGMSTEYVTSGITIQEWSVDTFTTGDGSTNTGTGDLTYGYPIRLAPELTYTKQRIDVRRTFFSYCPLGIIFTQAISEFSRERVISAHVVSPFVHLEYETTVYLICNVELDAEIYESALDDPFFRRGDWLWDPIIESFDPVIIVRPTPLDDLFDWWKQYGWIIILFVVIIIILYLFIQIGVPLLMKRQAVKMIRR